MGIDKILAIPISIFDSAYRSKSLSILIGQGVQTGLLTLTFLYNIL